RRGGWPRHCTADHLVEQETPTMWFLSRLHRRKAGRTPARVSRFLPRLEILEDRAVPSNLTLGPLVAGSLPDPLATSAHGNSRQLSTRDSEAEPWVAVNPTNPNNIVALWIAHDFAGPVASVTLDWGTTWQNVAIPGIADCTGGTGGGDPWLAFAPNRGLYAEAFANPGSTDISRSLDRGLTWGSPINGSGSSHLFTRGPGKGSRTPPPRHSN